MTNDKYKGWINRETCAANEHMTASCPIFKKHIMQSVVHLPEAEQATQVEEQISTLLEDIRRLVFSPSVLFTDGIDPAYKFMISEIGSLWRVDCCELAEVWLSEVRYNAEIAG